MISTAREAYTENALLVKRSWYLNRWILTIIILSDKSEPRLARISGFWAARCWETGGGHMVCRWCVVWSGRPANMDHRSLLVCRRPGSCLTADRESTPRHMLGQLGPSPRPRPLPSSPATHPIPGRPARAFPGNYNRGQRSELRALPGLFGGFPMSHVDFKKWHCRMSLSLIFFNVTCRV